MTHHQIVIIGAGTAGITVAARLLNENRKLDVALIDPSEKHYYQPAWTLVGAGAYKYQKTVGYTRDYIPRGANWIRDRVSEVDPENNKLKTESGEEISYDYLVVCPGVQYRLEWIEGLAETINKNGVCSNYIDSRYTWQVLQSFKGGNAVFTQPATPIKCGGAPQKIMYLTSDYIARHGLKDKSKVIFATPGSVIFGVEPFKDRLMEIVTEKDISLLFFHKPVKIDGPGHKVYFELMEKDKDKLFYNFKESLGYEDAGENRVSLPFEMLHLAPPQSAPDFIMHSKLAVQEGPDKGWVEVDIYSLQHKRYPNVFALGDVAALPTAKTGAAVRKQAPVLVKNLLAAMSGKPLQARYEGYSSCPIVTGYGRMLLAEFKYDNVRDSDPLLSKFFDTSKDSYAMWLLKKYLLPFMYWKLMLRGKA